VVFDAFPRQEPPTTTSPIPDGYEPDESFAGPEPPDPATVPVLPVEVAVVYSYPELFGTAEVTYIFPGGRTFLLEDGQEIENDNLKPGMPIRLGDGATGTVLNVRLIYEPPDPPLYSPDGKVVSRVVGTIRHIGVETISVSWPGYTATNSPDHLFFSASRDGYVPAKDLKVGEFLLTDADEIVPVLGVTKPQFGRTELYNMEVEHFHNYFVGQSGGHAVLVHNGVNPTACIKTPVQVAKEVVECPMPKGDNYISIQDLQARLPALNAERAKIGLKPLKIREAALAKPSEWYYDLSGASYYRRTAPTVDLSSAGITREVPCFPEGVQVATPQGHIAIESLSVGSEILAYDEETQSIVVQTVEAVLRSSSAHLVDVTVADETIQATLNHPFWVDSSRRWLAARELKSGMRLKLSDQSLATIESVALRRAPKQMTFNLTVAGCHNYFVGRTGVLVHNANNPNATDWFVYFGYSPTDTEFKNPIYVGKTNNLKATQTRHRADALDNPNMAYKKDMAVRPIEGMNGLTEEQALYQEAAIYHKMKDAGYQWGGQQQPMTKAKLNALAAKIC
jgi:hypothetical protein